MELPPGSVFLCLLFDLANCFARFKQLLSCDDVLTYLLTDAFETNLKFARIYLTYTGFAKFHNMVKLLINRRTYAPPTSHCNSKI